jgi:hypothetical protein
MAGQPDEKSSVFAIQSFAEVEAKARQVLKEKGFSDDLIEAQLARPTAQYPIWPSEGGPDGAGETGDGQ